MSFYFFWIQIFNLIIKVSTTNNIVQCLHSIQYIFQQNILRKRLPSLKILLISSDDFEIWRVKNTYLYSFDEEMYFIRNYETVYVIGK